MDTSTPQGASQWLIQNAGIFGVVILALSGTVVGLALELRRVYRERLQDARDNTKAMLDLNDKVHATMERVDRHLSNR